MLVWAMDGVPAKMPGNRPGIFTGFLAFSGSSPQIGPSRPAHNCRKCPTLGRAFSLARLIPAVPAKIQIIWPIAGYLRWHDGNKPCQRKYPADGREFSADMSWPRRADLGRSAGRVLLLVWAMNAVLVKVPGSRPREFESKEAKAPSPATRRTFVPGIFAGLAFLSECGSFC